MDGDPRPPESLDDAETLRARRGGSCEVGTSKRSSARRRDRAVGDVLSEIVERGAGESPRALAEHAYAEIRRRVGSAPEVTELEQLIDAMSAGDRPNDVSEGDTRPLDEVIARVLGEVLGTRAGEGHLALAYRAHEMIQARAGASPEVRTLQAWIHAMDEGKDGDPYG